jgi:hypothetical protein
MKARLISVSNPGTQQLADLPGWVVPAQPDESKAPSGIF